MSYLAKLRELEAATPNVHLHEGYVGARSFDLWSAPPMR